MLNEQSWEQLLMTHTKKSPFLHCAKDCNTAWQSFWVTHSQMPCVHNFSSCWYPGPSENNSPWTKKDSSQLCPKLVLCLPQTCLFQQHSWATEPDCKFRMRHKMSKTQMIQNSAILCRFTFEKYILNLTQIICHHSCDEPHPSHCKNLSFLWINLAVNSYEVRLFFKNPLKYA